MRIKVLYFGTLVGHYIDEDEEVVGERFVGRFSYVFLHCYLYPVNSVNTCLLQPNNAPKVRKIRKELRQSWEKNNAQCNYSTQNKKNRNRILRTRPILLLISPKIWSIDAPLTHRL